MVDVDKSHGYEANAAEFGRRRNFTIGVPEVEAWATTLPRGAAVLDVGCGVGAPISTALSRAGCDVYGVDASAAMIAAFKNELPGAHAVCEAIEDSSFFNRTFDGIISWGVMFLLPLGTQRTVIAKAARALKPGGSFVFTSPHLICTWNDALTGTLSMSPGAAAYTRILTENGLTLVRELDDEGGNHYYISIRSA